MTVLIKNLLDQKRPVLMGILNVTPDSFSDGLQNATTHTFVDKAKGLIADGCDILDVGGESTRPDANPVSEEEEKKRIFPFLEQFRKYYPEFPISLDTKKFNVAKQAMDYNISILNDVSFYSDNRFLELVADYDCHYVLMHTRGDSQTMTKLTQYPDGLVKTMQREIDKKLETMFSQGFSKKRIILDLGFGFAKTPEQCLQLFERLEVWQSYQLPLLLGISRKRFLQLITGKNKPEERDLLSAQLAVRANEKGFKIIRTHNVTLTKKTFSDRED